MDELDRAILEYLKSRDGSWRWVLGTKVFTRDETIRLYEKDKEFRKLIREQVYKLAVELFAKGKGQ
ncbi:MAG: hypothetical protein QW517_10575 [Thermofilaceae archaeon]